MFIEDYALGIQFDTKKIPLEDKEKCVFSLLYSRLTYEDMCGTEVCAGYPYEQHHEVYLVIFKSDHYKTVRKIFLLLRDYAALKLFLWDERPFIDKNRLAHLDEPTPYGKLDGKSHRLLGAPCGISELCPEKSGYNLSGQGVNIMLAPDSFKGSLTAMDVTKLLTLAICESDFRGCDVIPMPMADGGEGTLDAFAAFADAKKVKTRVHDPLGREIDAEYATLGDTAIIEMAKASGYALVKECERDIMRADSYGTGELILHAVNSGCTKITVAVGGSATNDGGLGCARALGVRFTDANGETVTGVGENILKIKNVDMSGVPQNVRRAQITVMCDVKNPLTGKDGATMVFSAQKGADKTMAAVLEIGMRNLSQVYDGFAGKKVCEREGAGAAGGMGAMLMALFTANTKKGIDTVLEMSDFDEKVKAASLIITGEGKLDSQTFSGGKAVAGVIAHASDVPYAILCGSVEDGAVKDYVPLVAVVNSFVTETQAMENAARYVFAAAKKMLALLAQGCRMSL